MKITINIDCTPEEARRYMGLPDVAPMQEAMLKEIQERMMASVTSMQPAEMMKGMAADDYGELVGYAKDVLDADDVYGHIQRRQLLE